MGVPDNEEYDNFGDNDPNDPNGAGNRGNKFKNYRNRGDRLDLNSNLANTSLTNRDQLNKLNIEKQVELKQTKTMVPKKEIKKYQNAPYSNQQLRDLGYSDKKIPRDNGNDRDPYGGPGYMIGSDDPNNRDRNGDNNDPNRDRNGDRNGDNGDPNDPNNRNRSYGNGGYGDGKNRGNNRDFENEPGYKVEKDNSYIRNNNQKSAIFVPINRRTVDPNEYRPVDTKLNGD